MTRLKSNDSTFPTNDRERFVPNCKDIWTNLRWAVGIRILIVYIYCMEIDLKYCACVFVNFRDLNKCFIRPRLSAPHRWFRVGCGWAMKCMRGRIRTLGERDENDPHTDFTLISYAISHNPGCHKVDLASVQFRAIRPGGLRRISFPARKMVNSCSDSAELWHCFPFRVGRDVHGPPESGSREYIRII
jgi:hypothetical protein